jgi:hypothetical protein
VCIENLIRIDCVTELPKTSSAMIALLSSFLILFASPFKSKSRLDAEDAVFGHQLIIWRRKVRGQRPPTKRFSRRIASPLPASLSFRQISCASLWSRIFNFRVLISETWSELA